MALACRSPCKHAGPEQRLAGGRVDNGAGDCAGPCRTARLELEVNVPGYLARDYLYFNHSGNRALRAGNWKAVSTPYRQSRWELYDLSNDRSETRDLASAHPGRLASMITRWQHLTRQFQDDRKR